ncbi:MAG: phage tail protein [Bryobacteraceae bacterium]|nr:phage tail protein [Bryobacteraceae bacterium]
MLRPDARNFRYFNRDGRWLDFVWSGLELTPSGSLALFPLPAAGEPVDLPLTEGLSAGIAVAPDGSVFASEPENGRILFIDACTGAAHPLPVEVVEPRGLAISSRHRALLVADAAAGRIAAFDYTTWSEAFRWYMPAPVSVACDDAGGVYVATSAGIRRFWPSGSPAPFAYTGPATACAVSGDSVFVLDAAGGTLAELDLEGQPRATVASGLAGATALAAAPGAVYVGISGRIAVYRKGGDGNWTRAGDAADFQGPVRALAAAGPTLYAHTGDASALHKLGSSGGYATEGTLTSGPLSASGRTVAWRRFEAIADIPEGASLEFSIAYSNSTTPPPQPWPPLDAGVHDAFLGHTARYLFIGCRFQSDGRATPALRQIRADFDQEGYLERLPAVYREESPEFTERFLALFETFHAGIERDIADLVALVDPEAVPEDRLPWLAGFLALPPDASRAAIAQAWDRYSRRGTAAGLRDALLESGVHATVLEPIQQASLWSLSASMLGVDTALTGSEPAGAIAGSSATLDRSHLIAAEEFGEPLFDEVAHRFSVLVYRAEAGCTGDEERVRAVVEAEKPAHTAGQVCFVSSELRIGFQATLGVDTLLGGVPAAAPLGAAPLVLASSPPGRLGRSAQVGVNTRL